MSYFKGKIPRSPAQMIDELSKKLSETRGVSLHEIDSLRAERDSLTERVRELTAERDSLRAENNRVELVARDFGVALRNSNAEKVRLRADMLECTSSCGEKVRAYWNETRTLRDRCVDLSKEIKSLKVKLKGSIRTASELIAENERLRDLRGGQSGE